MEGASRPRAAEVPARACLRVERTPADGNCFYRALLRTMDATGVGPSAERLVSRDRQMRRALDRPGLLAVHRRLADHASAWGAELPRVQWLRLVAAKRLCQDDLFGFCALSKADCVAECVRMGSYADHVFIQALASELGVCIAILHVDGQVTEVGDPRNAYLRLRLAHAHYDAVVPA